MLRGTVEGEQSAWDHYMDFVGKRAEVSTPKDLLMYIQRRRNEKDGIYNASALLLWAGIKSELLEDSPFLSPQRGLCATAVDARRGLFKAFISDVIPARADKAITTTWIYFEFYPVCCSWKSNLTDNVSFYDFRECTPEEQSILIEEVLGRRNETYAGALRHYYRK